MTRATNIHGTAIVVGTTGLLFVGPSGSGKTAAALHCIGRAQERGLFAALVSDDQVLVEMAGGRIVARPPATIAGMAEIRASGIVSVETIGCAILQQVVRPVHAPFDERIAPEGEQYEILPGHRLPVVRLPVADGFDCFQRLVRLLPRLIRN